MKKRAIGTFRLLTLDFNCWHVFDFLYDTTVTHYILGGQILLISVGLFAQAYSHQKYVAIIHFATLLHFYHDNFIPSPHKIVKEIFPMNCQSSDDSLDSSVSTDSYFKQGFTLDI